LLASRYCYFLLPPIWLAGGCSVSAQHGRAGFGWAVCCRQGQSCLAPTWGVPAAGQVAGRVVESCCGASSSTASGLRQDTRHRGAWGEAGGEAGGKAVRVVGGIGAAGLLSSAFHIGVLLEQNPSLVSVPGTLCLIFNLGSAGKGADLDRQPQSYCFLDGLLGEQP